MSALLLFLTLTPASAAFGSESGLELLRAGRYGEAAPYLEAAVARSPASGVAHYRLGFCRLALGDLDGAASALKRAVELEPRRPEWLHALAKAELDRGRAVAARLVLDRAIALDPRVEYRLARATTWIAAGRAERGESDLRAVLRARPRDATALFELGRIESDRGRPAEAVRLLRRCVEADAEHVECRFRLALALARGGDRDEALAELEAVLDRVPGHVGALYNAARILRETERTDAATAMFERFRDASRLEDRIRFVEEFVRLDPRNPAKHRELARLRLEAGRGAAARDAARQAVTLAPRDAAGWQLLAAASARVGAGEEAGHAREMARRLAEQEGGRP